jgi:hypothetical protein
MSLAKHTPTSLFSETLTTPANAKLEDVMTAELAQALAARLAIASGDWHRLKGNRAARAKEQAAIALVYLMNDNPAEALPHLQQATGWLDRSITAPPCPSHGHH